MNIVDTVSRFIRSHSLLKKGDRVIVAVSGGPDSVALLKILLILRKKLRLELFVAHYNHALRGRDSDADERRAAELAQEWNLPFYVRRDRRPLKKPRRVTSLEEALRIRRYRFFIDLAGKIRAGKITTAHTSDDQAETVLMRLLRGAGLRGLGAMRPSRREGKYEIVRPLLCVLKKEVLKFLKSERLDYRHDLSNRSPDFTRNRIRHRLLPLLEREYNPKVKSSLAETAVDAQRLYEFVREEAARRYLKFRRNANGRIALKKTALTRLSDPLRAEIYFLAIEEAAGTRRSIDRVHLESIENLSLANAEKKELRLPRGIHVKSDRAELIFSRKD